MSEQYLLNSQIPDVDFRLYRMGLLDAENEVDRLPVSLLASIYSAQLYESLSMLDENLAEIAAEMTDLQMQDCYVFYAYLLSCYQLTNEHPPSVLSMLMLRKDVWAFFRNAFCTSFLDYVQTDV